MKSDKELVIEDLLFKAKQLKLIKYYVIDNYGLNKLYSITTNQRTYYNLTDTTIYNYLTNLLK